MNTQMTIKPLLVSVEEAAYALSLHPQTIHRMRREQQIEIVKIRGRALVPVREIERLARSKIEDVEPIRALACRTKEGGAP